MTSTVVPPGAAVRLLASGSLVLEPGVAAQESVPILTAKERS
jgi:hypothetical protein